MALFKKKDKKEKEILLDRRLLSYIQPKGGITYRDEKFISTGDTYICCIHIYEFPKTIGDFWLEKLMNIPNTIGHSDRRYRTGKKEYQPVHEGTECTLPGVKRL